MKKNIKNLYNILIFTVCLEIVIRLAKFPIYFLPTPSKVIFELFKFGKEFLNAMKWTSLEALVGFLFAFLFATLCALFFVLFKPVEEGARPFLIALQGTPILALAPILNAWFGSGFGSKVASAFVVCFFPLIVGFTTGLRSPLKEELELYKTFGASDWAILFKLRIPRSVPWIFSSLKVAVPLSVIGAVVGEFVGASRGLGFEILSASYYLMIPKMFAGVFCCTILSIILFFIVRIIEKKMFFWEGKE